MSESGAVSRGQDAIVYVLRAFGARSERNTPWMSAADLAHAAGMADEHVPEFEANVQALYDAGVIRLMSGGNASGKSFYEVMLVPPEGRNEGSRTDEPD
jgi:hypothetical protein